MAINFKTILEQIQNGITNIAQTSLQDYLTQAKSDGQEILKMMAENLKKWTTQLENGEITEDDFKDLLLDQVDMLEAAALTQAGVAAIRVDQFKKDILNLVVNIVTAAI